MILDDKAIRFLIKDRGLITDYVNLKNQLKQNGFDLTLREAMQINGPGQLDFDNTQRQIPFAKEIEFKQGWVVLKPGTYLVTTNEYLKLPSDIIAMVFPKPSLLRIGAYTVHNVLEAGFEGRLQFLLIVKNQYGVKLQENARISKLVFMKIGGAGEKYQGMYKTLG